MMKIDRKAITKLQAIVAAIIVIAAIIGSIYYYYTSITPTEQYILIGVPGPFTGSAAEKGLHLRCGIELAAEEINQNGGILGRKIRLIYGDTEAKAEVGVSVYQRLIAKDNVFAIVGEVNSHVALACMDVVAKYGVPTIFAIPASDEIGKKIMNDPEKYKWIYMVDINITSMDHSFFMWFDELMETWNPDRKTAAILVEDTDFGRGVGDVYKTELQKRGWDIVLYEVLPFGATDYYSVLTRVKALKPKLIKIEITSLSAGVAITKQMAELGINALIIGGYYQKTVEFPQLAGEFAEYQINRREPYPKEWEEKLKQRFPYADPIASMYSYDALYILKDAIERAGSLDKNAVLEALSKTDYKGVFMRTVFSPTTHFPLVGKEYKVYGVGQFRNGTLMLIWPEEYAEATFELPPNLW